MDSVERLKCEAGIAACDFIKDGMKLGLGTGSTVRYTVIEIGRRISEEGLNVVGVPTSEATRELAEEVGIPMITLADSGGLDLVIDGADEFNSEFSLIKGGGGALTREKIVAQSSKSMIVVADDRKQVEILGEFDLPVEVLPFEWKRTRDRISLLCPGSVSLRGDSEPFVTDNGCYILDCNFGPSISDPISLEQDLLSIAGVVEVGLFVGICDAVVLASNGGVLTLINQSGRLNQ
ncbi:MAG TPA: ribose-5-phosphate isomerase RpiA [Candidatus Thalassarchaeaceae archaeon]|jgi:ribose 5-phosphate isomerase A|nr:ribose-5-phosphate isomerase RpiA [Euryarchaeota archaeon]MBT4475044.1 ribose-5-phosphate isomerase RpiA [Euryarchaeota archaeon]MBT6075489.1 ribose-5-phosphate isomerase RpiA [Euryarchaeota archaeon]DAC63437.1 MAG TPA: ribose-5-phosphate isomerase RpiA [Candidatus Poseidoniales archaeon]HII12586.1 ribose-5-phosphate isomerase RpiA [Candidatus Thalassarchaeaceae archaeon]